MNQSQDRWQQDLKATQMLSAFKGYGNQRIRDPLRAASYVLWLKFTHLLAKDN